jgi:hypothetical protein
MLVNLVAPRSLSILEEIQLILACNTMEREEEELLSSKKLRRLNQSR